MIKFAGELVAYIRECVVSHNASTHTEIFVRAGPDGPLLQISRVMMMEDVKGRAIILETSAVIQS